MTRSTLRFLLWLGAAIAVTAWLVLAWRALAAPTGTDALEATVLRHAASFAHGESPYGEPHDGMVPVMPAVPLAVAWLMRTFDAGAWAARFVSLFATLLAAILVALVVGDETRTRTLGVAAGALLLMGQGLSAGVAGAARLEPPMLLLVLLGCVALRYTAGIAGALLASVALGAACFVHPAGILFALAALCHLGFRDPPRFIAYGLGLAALLWIAQLELGHALGPWFNWAAWDAGVQALRFEPVALLRFVGTQLLGTLGVFTLATVLSFALPIRPWSGAVGIWTWMAFAAVAAGITSTQAPSGPAEATRVAAVMLAIVGPVSVQRITQHLSNWPGGSRMGGQAVVLTAIALQFVTLLAGGLVR